MTSAEPLRAIVSAHLPEGIQALVLNPGLNQGGAIIGPAGEIRTLSPTEMAAVMGRTADQAREKLAELESLITKLHIVKDGK